MPLLAALRENLGGAWMVMRGRPEGLDRLDLTLAGFWRSFAAIVLVMPFAMLGLISQRRLEAATPEAPPAPEGGLALETVAVFADWLAFPIVFALIARPLGLGARYVPFIVVRNWSAVIVSAAVGVIHAAHLTGLLPSGLASGLLLAALPVVLAVFYVVVRTALAVSIAVAAPIAVLDFLLSLLIWGILVGVA